MRISDDDSIQNEEVQSDAFEERNNINLNETDVRRRILQTNDLYRVLF